MKNKVTQPKQAFSKALLVQESILIWVITIAFIVLAIFGISNLGIAIAADTGVAILVILNGLRLFKSS
jgi:Cd2+/Zn2+-exporting ATPase